MLIGVDGPSPPADRARAQLRREVREVVTRALASIRLRREDILDADHGEDVQFQIPPSVSPARLVSTFADAINGELARMADRRGPADSVRFRVAVHCHAGSDHDPPVTAMNLLSALVAAQPLRDALRAASRAYLALIVSDETYRALSDGGYRSIDTAAFVPLSLEAAEFGTVTGWITVPGYAAPPGIERDVARGAGLATHLHGGSRYVQVTGGQIANFVQGDQVVKGDLIFGSMDGETRPAAPRP
ncbi:MAG TPA: hypothetical protein VN695_18740 [Streptosporangiaceae bacterium]|nr:hypothetical protein [Streptosporangiaceae bacterium]